jgi:hypothetical protein
MKNFGLKEGLFGVIGILVVALPFLAFGGHNVLYVDKNATGTETGSSSDPYKSIGTALKHANNGDEVRVKSGTYKENIVISKEVKVTSDKNDRDKVTIIGDDNEPTVLMKDGAKLSKVTIENGRHGIRVDKNAEAHIFDVLVDGSDRDGIHIDESKKKDKKHRVLIDKVEVKKSERAGIYSEERFVVITKSNIHDNDRDGIDLQGDVKAWIEDTRVNENNGSGLKVSLNGADIWTEKLSIRNNKREGVEVSASTNETGSFGLKKATIVDNKNFGVAKLRRGTAPASLLHDRVFIEKSRVESNGKGIVSGVISVK